MSNVARVGDLSTGHDACPPVPITDGSPNVFINGKPVAREGDPFAVHGCIVHAPHIGYVASGSSTVFVNDKPIARVGDPVTCGGNIAQGSDNVIAGG